MGRAVIWLGAGFSVPAGGPLASELLSPAVLEHSKADPLYLTAILDLEAETRPSSGIDLETTFSKIWRASKVTGRVLVRDETLDAVKVLNQLRVHLASVTGRARLRKGGNSFKTYAKFFSKVLRRSRRLTIVTTNYDLVVERLFESMGFPMSYGRAGGMRIDRTFPWQRSLFPPKTRIFKLHGSCNWGLCDSCGQLTAFGDPYIPRFQRRKCEQCRQRYLDLGLVPPIHSKASELESFRGFWRAAEEELLEADSLLVVGYSLPVSDEEGRDLLSVTRTGDVARNTVVCSGHDKDTRNRFADAIPEAKWADVYFDDYLSKGRPVLSL